MINRGYLSFKKDNNFGQNLEQVLIKAMLQNTHSLKHTLPHTHTHIHKIKTYEVMEYKIHPLKLIFVQISENMNPIKRMIIESQQMS